MSPKPKQHGNAGNRNAAKPATKSTHLHIRIDPADKALAESAAQAAGLSVAQYVTRLIRAQTDNTGG